MKRTVLAMVCGFVFAAPVSAVQSQSIERSGSGCPSGYSLSGTYSTPRSGAGFAIHRVGGGCPSGYSVSGNYCVARKGAGHAMRRSGGCPSGYSVSGSYCVQR